MVQTQTVQAARLNGRPPVALFEKCRNFTIATELKEADAYPYFTPIASAQRPEIICRGRRMLMLGTNSYLGLGTDPKVVRAAIQAIERYGTSCTGSRFLNGTLELHEELERRLADFVGKERALVFTTGYQTNLGIIDTLVGKRDYVIIDKTDHASIVDGARMSYGSMCRFSHNDADDLDRVLRKCGDETTGRLIVIDGVYSMEGDIADLPAIAEVARKHRAALMIDDAHAFGVLGPNGNGTAAHFNLTDEVDLIMGTFSKSFASIGGFVAGDRELIDYIQHYARPMIFSASLAPAQVAAALAALDIFENEPERRQRLWRNTEFLGSGLRDLGFSTGLSETPILPVFVGERDLCFATWHELRNEGVFVNPIISPAVPPDQSILRVSIMATHTREHLQEALDIFERVGQRLGLI